VDTWQDMVEYVGFTPADTETLRVLWPAVEPRLGWAVDRFYAAILRSPGARAVLEDEAQVERLKRTLSKWVLELLTGPHDEAYADQRARIGRVHVRVGLPQRYVFTAMNLLRQDLITIAYDSQPPDRARRTVEALGRITDLELAVMNATYLEAHEEQELRSLQDLIIRHMPVTILCLDAQGVVTAATHPNRRVFGDRAGVGSPFDEFLPPPLVEAGDLSGMLGRALATGEEVAVSRVEVPWKGGLPRYFALSVVPLDHEVVRALVHVEDLTEVVNTEARLRDAEALARMGHLAATIAHEVRNPLTGIATALQVITGTLPEDDQRRVILGKVREQIDRLAALVRDLLAYARPARASQPNSVPVDVAAAARDAATLESGVTLALADPVVAMGDPQLVSQILVNLLVNARDACGPEGVITLQAGPGPTWTVQDDGPGVPSDVVQTLFEPFVTTKARGTGLGLAIGSKLARAMGGRLELLPSERGARFRLALPAAQGSAGR